MNLMRLKHFLPRAPSGIYGRSALILLMPIIGLQIVVSFVFIKNDLEDITQQMAQTMAREFILIQHEIDAYDTQQEALARLSRQLKPLNIELRFLAAGEMPPENQLSPIEYTGRVVLREFTKRVPGFISLQLPPGRQISTAFNTSQGVAVVQYSRRRVTPAAPHQLIVTMVFFGLFLGMISMVYMRNQLRPIKRLADAAEAFGRGRLFPYQPRGATEVRAAGAAFIDMRARIERQIEQRTLMLSGVSHDLRTPLTRMKLELALMDEDEAAPLLSDVKEMEAMVDAFLDFSRGVSTSAMEETNPFDLVNEATKRWRDQGHDVTLSMRSDTRVIPLRAAAVRRAVDNLISNAVRYGTCARVTVVVMKKALRIRVEDDGPGIPIELRGDAIKPFTRLDPARNQDLGTGVGLGLAIVADIARAHGGTLRLGTSEDLGGLRADILIAL